MEQIEIKGLTVFARHGVLTQEQQLGQKFVYNVTMELSMSAAAKGDQLDETINYARVCQMITEFEQAHPVKLLETAAAQLAEYLLLQVTFLLGVTVEIEKPWAPIGLPLSAVSVKMHRAWHRVFVSLGSNMGDREAILKRAVTNISQLPTVRETQCSPWLWSKPYGVVDQPEFLNGCMEFMTILEPLELLDILQAEEQKADRVRTLHWGPRTLDLDIILYDDLVMNTERLTLPHPQMEKRMFVLEPLCLVAPWLVHPVSHKLITDLRDHLMSITESGVDQGTIIER